jgi:magnesium transporter
MTRPRRESRPVQSAFGSKSPQLGTSFRAEYTNPFIGRSRRQPQVESAEESDEDKTDDRTPLISTSNRDRTGIGRGTGTSYGIDGADSRGRRESKLRRSSLSSNSAASPIQHRFANRSYSGLLDYNINNPPSMPGSPQLGPKGSLDDVMVSGFPRSPEEHRRATIATGDHLIDIDHADVTPPSPRGGPGDFQRRRTIAATAEDDVCFPLEGMSEIAEEDFQPPGPDQFHTSGRRRRRRVWPDLSVLDEWSREEKEERSDGVRAKAINEPIFVGGRLRASNVAWHRTEEDAPYRFTYFNEDFDNTIHAQTISELVQPGASFKELFIPDPPELSESASEDEDNETLDIRDFAQNNQPLSPSSTDLRGGTRHTSIAGDLAPTKTHSPDGSGIVTPMKGPSPLGPKPKRYGPRPIWWLDVLSPTDTEMRVIAKAFGIHALTTEDILVQEAREKVELFRNYYFINYRTFEQDTSSEDYLEPVNMYVIVFREGVLSFHFSMTPHPANVRRRVRQLKDYMILSSDWISYAIIDDVTDTYAPLIQTIEDEVDDIDEQILKMHSSNKDMSSGDSKDKSFNEKASDSGETVVATGGDMLRRVGTCRKKVMGLYRLLGNKADVIKGFAKRCNEQWEVAPKSEIGLYLGDIQDHILTMTSNLSHYETLLSRAHSNYIAQISIRMNERQELSADVLGKLTVLGTIVLPMNIICGMWGMNVKVPGQELDNLYWFWSSESLLPFLWGQFAC